MSRGFRPASLSAASTGPRVFATRSAVRSSSLARESVITRCFGPDASAVTYVNPPPCAYDLTPQQVEQAAKALELHGIRVIEGPDGTLRVPMGQEAEPVIALLLDGRGSRDLVQGTPFIAPPFDVACGWIPERSNTGATATAAGLALLAGLTALVARRRMRMPVETP
jgi:hypothetical protein